MWGERTARNRRASGMRNCAWRVGAREHEKATLHETLLNILLNIQETLLNAPYSSCLAL